MGGAARFDLTPYLEHGVFRELKDPLISTAWAFNGVQTWPHDQDIAPENTGGNTNDPSRREHPPWN